MPVTGLSSRNRSRRVFLALCAVALHGEEPPSTLKLLTDLSAKLSDNNFPGAVDAFAATMPGYSDVVANLGALANQYDVICVIEIKDESGDETRRKAETEWFLQLKSKQESGPTERRTVTVRISTERVKGKWRITSLEPRSALAPPEVR
jgi:hypothetical protein